MNSTMAEQKVRLEPPGPIVFAGPFNKKRRVERNLFNISGNTIIIKVKCNDDSLRANPVFSMVEPTRSMTMTFQCHFVDGTPKPQTEYALGLVIADFQRA